MQSFQAETSGRAHAQPALRAVGNVELLPFTVRVVRTQSQLDRVCELRSLAYGHHVSQLAEAFARPDVMDYLPGTLNLLAEDKETQQVIGAARFQLNTHGPLQIEESIQVPEHISNLLLAEITRLSVRPGYAGTSIVRNALWKSIHRYCLATQVQAMLIGSRKALLRQYAMLGFDDVFEDRREFSCAHAGGLPHRALIFDVQGAERRWRASQHPMYKFMFETFHPDLHVFDAVSSSWSTPRSTVAAPAPDCQEATTSLH